MAKKLNLNFGVPPSTMPAVPMSAPASSLPGPMATAPKPPRKRMAKPAVKGAALVIGAPPVPAIVAKQKKQLNSNAGKSFAGLMGLGGGGAK